MKDLCRCYVALWSPPLTLLHRRGSNNFPCVFAFQHCTALCSLTTRRQHSLIIACGSVRASWYPSRTARSSVCPPNSTSSSQSFCWPCWCTSGWSTMSTSIPLQQWNATQTSWTLMTQRKNRTLLVRQDYRKEYDETKNRICYLKKLIIIIFFYRVAAKAWMVASLLIANLFAVI